MIKIMPNLSITNNLNSIKHNHVSFLSTQDNQFNFKHKEKDTDVFDKKAAATFSDKPINIPWVKEKNLNEALNHLNKIEFNNDDVKKVQNLGAVMPFKSGKEAVKYIEDNHIEVKFAPIESEHIHAQYDFDDNCIKINDLYKDAKEPAEIFAIAEAILHEAGHAKDKDSKSSIQEEIDCLAMNAIAHRSIKKNHPKVFDHSDALIIKDGVSVYSDLFFNTQQSNKELIKRVNKKYGHLPIGDFKHPPSQIAIDAKCLQNQQ